MTEICECIGCEIYRIKDMMRTVLWNSGAQGYVIGISGGIDSAVACALAVRAAGAERVVGVFMPASEHGMSDRADAAELCSSLGVELLEIPLMDVVSAFRGLPEIEDTPIQTGNISARLRMIVLYNIAARLKYLVCGTSNRSEYMVGYSTKWGDSAADVQPLLHLCKNDVYALAEELDIPESIRKKIPSAGFFAGQTDESELGLTYGELDGALSELERNSFVPETEIQRKVMEMMKNSAHKRSFPVSLYEHHPLSNQKTNTFTE